MIEQKVLDEQIVPVLQELLNECVEANSESINVRWIQGGKWNINAEIIFTATNIEESNESEEQTNG